MRKHIYQLKYEFLLTLHNFIIIKFINKIKKKKFIFKKDDILLNNWKITLKKREAKNWIQIVC